MSEKEPSKLWRLLRAIIRLADICCRDGWPGVRYRILLLQKNPEVIVSRWPQLRPLAVRLAQFSAWQSRRAAHRRGMRKQMRCGDIRFQLDQAPPCLVVARQAVILSGWAVDLRRKSPAAVRVVIGKKQYPAVFRERLDVQRALSLEARLPSRLGFGIAVSLEKSGVYRACIEVEADGGAWITVHRFFLWRRTESTRGYLACVRSERKQLEEELPEIKAHISVMVKKPFFTIAVKPGSASAHLQKTLASLEGQIYPHFNSIILQAGEERLPDVKGDYLLLLKAGQLLACNALYEFASEINRDPDAEILYADEDKIDGKARRYAPFYKPDWSPDYLETFDYVGFPVCISAALAATCFTPHGYGFILKATEKTRKISHIGKILGHDNGTALNAAEDIAALEARLKRTGRKGAVRENALHKGCYDIELNLRRSPLISIIIPTAGRTVEVGERRIDMISNIVQQIRAHSTYKNIEIIVVDNGDLSPEQMKILSDAGCRRLTYTDPVLNIPKKLSLGASAASGEYFILMNDDIEILTPSWIERMLEHFEKSHVGVVGGKLLYPEGLTQHVGIAHIFGNPAHVRWLFPRYDAGYFFSSCGVRNYTAMTGACMMTPARLYKEVGGYSPELAICCNDIDYCLKVRSRGFEVVYAPEVELIHMESMSRVASHNIEETQWYQQRWAAESCYDRYYNERFLSVTPPTFEPHANRRNL